MTQIPSRHRKCTRYQGPSQGVAPRSLGKPGSRLYLREERRNDGACDLLLSLELHQHHDRAPAVGKAGQP